MQAERRGRGPISGAPGKYALVPERVWGPGKHEGAQAVRPGLPLGLLSYLLPVDGGADLAEAHVGGEDGLADGTVERVNDGLVVGEVEESLPDHPRLGF